MTVHIIGELTRAENAREQYRAMMRLAKRPQDRAEYKREFRKARNKALALREKVE